MKGYFHWPLKGQIRISQHFGENRACWDTEGRIQKCDGNNPPEGWRSIYGPEGHTGIDLVDAFGSSDGDPVYCAATGHVIGVDTNSWSGYDVRVLTTDEETGDTYVHIYEHLKEVPRVKVNQKVVTGQKFRGMGMTGQATGPHLHFELRRNGKPVDPEEYLSNMQAKQVLKLTNTLTFISEKVKDLAEAISVFIRRGN